MKRPAQEARPQGRTAAVFCTTFLPYTQTFVWDEIRSHEAYAIEVFAWRLQNAERFPAVKVHVARPWYVVSRQDARFDRRFSAGDIALVHAHFGWAAVYAARYARLYSRPLIVSFHGYDVALITGKQAAPPRLWPYTLRAQEMLETMDLGLCASSELLELLVARGVPRDRLVEHRLGIDLERFKPGAREPSALRVAMIGRFVEKKGFADGIRAFELLLRRVGARDVELVVAGSGPLGRDLRRLAQTLGIEANVRFAGELSHEAVAALLSTSDVLLAPSTVAADGDRDSGLIVVKEASACECVPIGTRHGGIPDIIEDGVTGFLVPERDIEGMAARLAELARDAALRRSMGRAARGKMAREYELRSSVRRLEGHYDQAIERYATRSAVPRPG